jgi:activator of 2-hydroxyglutaryl-CoA dehydratase
MEARYMVGLDVGSTTVKAIVSETQSDKIVWRDYQRHETKQPEKVLEFLRRIEAEAGVTPENSRAFITGSGGGTLAELVGAKFVQEVTAVSLAVEKMHPEVYSVIELGGQDAKIIVFKDDPESGRKKKIPSMNDKCAGGTGAVIDKINAKLKIPAEQLSLQGYDGIKLHKVAGKCGVFAETDVNGLQKEGTPPDELMASLFEAIVLQNLSVLTRGHTLRPHVLLLGGPNTFIRGMREAWQANIPRMWKDRKVEVPEGSAPQELIKVPQNAQYFAALGAVEFGKTEDEDVGRYRGVAKLVHYIDFGRTEEKATSGRIGCFQVGLPPEEIRSRHFSIRNYGRRFCGCGWRLHFHQGCTALGRWRHPVQSLSAFEWQSDPGHDRHVRKAARSSRVSGREDGGARGRHHRLRQGHS